MNKRITDG